MFAEKGLKLDSAENEEGEESFEKEKERDF